MKPHVAPHPLAEEVRCNQVDQGHVYEDPRRDAVEDAFGDKRPGTVGVVEGRNGGADGNAGRGGYGEEAGHEDGGEGPELGLGDATSQGKSLEELME